MSQSRRSGQSAFIALIAGLPIAFAAPALADGHSTARDGTDFVVTLGAGVNAEPDYLGSDDYEAGFFPIIGVERPGDDGPRGFFIRPSLGFVGERKSGDNPALAGLDDVDFTVELGVKVGYESRIATAFAAVRHGIGGHEGIVADIGLDFTANPMDRLTITGGPRLTIVSDDYMETYFGVTPAEAITSAYAAYDPDGGIKSTGLEAEAVYEVTERTNLHLRAEWEHLLGDAADSPFVDGPGSANQFTVGIGLSHEFEIDLWD